jgi:hypothetical protein
MYSFSKKVLIAAALLVPIASFAQSFPKPITRSDINSQVAEAQQQGTLRQSKVHYPQATDMANGPRSADSAYGETSYGSSQASHVELGQGIAGLFKHH